MSRPLAQAEMVVLALAVLVVAAVVLAARCTRHALCPVRRFLSR
jgi:hypothetical protein